MLPSRKNANWLPSIFDDMLESDWLMSQAASSPAMNVIETDKEIKVEIAAPGMTKDDFVIHIDEHDRLQISMEKKEESKPEEKEKKRYLRCEFSYKKFMQTLYLPDNVKKDEISAEMKDGILTITLPKRTPEDAVKAQRKIEVK